MALARRAAEPNGAIDSNEYASFVKNLEKCARNKEAFAKEKANAAFAMENGHPYTDKPANLSDPAHQLLWAATILYANKDLSANLTTWSDYPMNKGIGERALHMLLKRLPRMQAR